MKINVNTDKISDALTKINIRNDNIKNSKNKITNVINQLDRYYLGNDASVFKNKYLDTISSLDFVIDTVDSYVNYFKLLVNNYNDNQIRALNSIMYLSENIDFSNNNSIEDLFTKKYDESIISDLHFLGSEKNDK